MNGENARHTARRYRRLIILGVLLVLGLGGLAATQFDHDRRETGIAAATPIVFQLSWKHNGAYAGYYAADQQGYYRDEGLEVSFLQGGPTIDPTTSVIEGKAQLGTANANLLIKARAEGKPVRAVAAIHRRVPVVFITLKSSGITHPRQFVGKTINVSVQNLPILRAVASRAGVEADQYQVTHEYDLEILYSGEAQVYVGFLFEQTEQIRAAGYEINEIHPSDFGVHFYNNCIFATDEFIENHPDLISRFLRSTLKLGWPYALQNIGSVGVAVTQYDPAADQEEVISFLTGMIPLINTGEDQIGWMRPEVWAEMTANQVRMGLVRDSFRPDEVYTTHFLEEVYGETQ